MAGEFLYDVVLDGGLDFLDTDGTQLNICSQAPVDYGEATTDGTYSLGVKTSYSIPVPVDNASDGRKVVCPAITDGVVHETGTATHYAITDGASVLLATGPLSASQAVTDTNTFTLTSFEIVIPDATVT